MASVDVIRPTIANGMLETCMSMTLIGSGPFLRRPAGSEGRPDRSCCVPFFVGNITWRGKSRSGLGRCDQRRRPDGEYERKSRMPTRPVPDAKAEPSFSFGSTGSTVIYQSSARLTKMRDELGSMVARRRNIGIRHRLITAQNL